MEYDRITLGRLAKEQGFVRDTLEKVCRLTDILLFMQHDSLLNSRLALKGGTAINLTVFDLPCLSVDIDLDYVGAVSREQMMEDRRRIRDRIGIAFLLLLSVVLFLRGFLYRSHQLILSFAHWLILLVVVLS